MEQGIDQEFIGNREKSKLEIELMSKVTRQNPLHGDIDGNKTDTDNKTDRKVSGIPSEELSEIQTLKPIDMFGELERLNYLKPATDDSQLVIPTAYKSVPLITTEGSSMSSVHDEDC